MAKKRINIALGDIFELPLKNKTKCYFQFTMNDLQQLNIPVVRVFKKRYPKREKPSLENIINDQIAFYAHVMIHAGLTYDHIKKVGNLPLEDNIEPPYFKQYQYTWDKEKSSSEDWYIWQADQIPMKERLNSLTEEQANYENGKIYSVASLIDRLNTDLPNM